MLAATDATGNTPPEMSNVDRCPACGTVAGGTADHLGCQLSSCDACGLWFWPARTAADYEAVYDTAEYQQVQTDDLEATTDPLQFARHPTYASFFREAKPEGGKRLLDLGCGVGRFLHAALKLGWDVRGIDASAKAIEIGKRTATFPLSTETLQQLRDSGARFDVVTAFEVLEHLERPVDVLRSVSEVLAPGGLFFGTVPNRLSPTVQTTRRQDWLPPVHLQYFTAPALQRTLERGGFAPVRTGFVWGGTWPQLEPSVAGLRRLAGYALRRMQGKIRPDPLGIWAAGCRLATTAGS